MCVCVCVCVCVCAHMWAFSYTSVRARVCLHAHYCGCHVKHTSDSDTEEMCGETKVLSPAVCFYAFQGLFVTPRNEAGMGL